MSKDQKVTIKSTSDRSAEVSDISLRETKTTRLVVRPEIVHNEKNKDASVRLTFLFQKKGVKAEWEDSDSIPLSSLKAGEGVKLELKSGEVLGLFEELSSLYKLYKNGGIAWGENEYVLAGADEILRDKPSRIELIKQIINKGFSSEVWTQLSEIDSKEAINLSYLTIHQKRVQAVQEFEESIRNPDLAESYWQSFFEQNEWIFGFNLDFRFLHKTTSQPYYGGRNLEGSGDQRGDILSHTAGSQSFTVLVEIKKPSTLLVDGKYRNAVYPPSKELSGGVSQLQVNCRKWDLDGSRSEDNREILNEQKIYTVRPKGILVIGDLGQLQNKIEHRNAFELYRRNIHNPEIVTFDEVLNRARFLVQHEESNSQEEEFPF